MRDTPTTFEEAMKYEQAEPNMTARSFMPGRISSRGRQHEGSNYAGYGGEKDVDIEQTERFARLIERGVATAVGTDESPLLALRYRAARRRIPTDEHLSAPVRTARPRSK